PRASARLRACQVWPGVPWTGPERASGQRPVRRRGEAAQTRARSTGSGARSMGETPRPAGGRGGRNRRRRRGQRERGGGGGAGAASGKGLRPGRRGAKRRVGGTKRRGWFMRSGGRAAL